MCRRELNNPRGFRELAPEDEERDAQDRLRHLQEKYPGYLQEPAPRPQSPDDGRS